MRSRRLGLGSARTPLEDLTGLPNLSTGLIWKGENE